MIKVDFVIPGDLARPTGGYEYARQLLTRFVNFGVNARHFALEGDFPTLETLIVDRALDTIETLANANVVLVDGLAFGCLTAARLSRIKRKIVALVHHPLANESGLPADVAAKLFEPFVTGKPQGVGLGLAVAKQAADAHGGRIDWRRDEGRTVFRVAFGEPGA